MHTHFMYIYKFVFRYCGYIQSVICTHCYATWCALLVCHMLCAVSHHDTLCRTPCGTCSYSAPEVLVGLAYDPKDTTYLPSISLLSRDYDLKDIPPPEHPKHDNCSYY